MTKKDSSVWQARVKREQRARRAIEQLLEDKSRAFLGQTKRLREQIEELASTKRELEATTHTLSRALEAAAAGNQSKSQFLATMSHELRTPLNAVIGFSEIMKDEIFGPVGSERYKDYAASIHKSGSHLLGLINDILDISKFDAGKLELHDDTVDAGRIAADCASLMEPQAQKAKVHCAAKSRTAPSSSDATTAGYAKCCSICSRMPSSSRRRAATSRCRPRPLLRVSP